MTEPHKCMNDECDVLIDKPGVRHCSSKCRSRDWHLARRKPIEDHQCNWVDCTVIISGRKAIFCSANCRAKDYYSKNQEKAKAANRALYHEHQDERLESARIYGLAHAESRRARATAWRIANPERRNEHRRVRRARMAAGSSGPISQDDVAAKMAYWGDKCWMCGGPYETVDHVKPLSRGGRHVLSNLRPSCKQCNFRKGMRWKGVADLRSFKYSELVADRQSA